MILITEGPSAADPTDMCPISVGYPLDKPVYFAVVNPRPSLYWHFGFKHWWVNMYRYCLVGLIRRHIRKTMEEN
jgi:hypothetical protein